jgi:hypothetical protein
MADRRFEPPRDHGLPAATPHSSGLLWTMLLLAVAIGAAGVTAMNFLQSAIERWVTSDAGISVERLTLVFVILAAVVDLPLVLAGLYLWRVGERTMAAARFPPPGMVMWRSADVLTGERAVRRGRLAQVSAIALFFSGVVLVAILVRLAFLVNARS